VVLSERWNKVGEVWEKNYTFLYCLNILQQMLFLLKSGKVYFYFEKIEVNKALETSISIDILNYAYLPRSVLLFNLTGVNH